jgi:hypothetical protein
MNAKRKELLQILEYVKERRLSLKQAAAQVPISYRQLRRLYSRFAEAGEAGLVHGLRGKPSNRSMPAHVRRHIIAYYQKRLTDLGPSRAAKRLAAMGYSVSRETLRRWLIDEGLRQNGKRACRGREVKENFGEMLLLVCRNFSLFREKSKLRLLFAVDDATHTCMCRVVEHTAESAAMKVLAAWVSTYGIPMSLACDRHYLTFRDRSRGEGMWPDLLRARRALGRALEKLGVDAVPMSCALISARVGAMLEKYVSGVKVKIRTGGVTSVEQANALLQGPAAVLLGSPRVKPPAGAQDFHVRLQPGDDPDKIFRYEYETEVPLQGIVTYNNRRFRVAGYAGAEAKAGRTQKTMARAAPERVLLTEDLNGRVRIFHGKTELEIRELE